MTIIFEPSNPDEHFTSLMPYFSLANDAITPEHTSFLSAFADYYSAVPKYFSEQKRFQDTELVSQFVTILSGGKTPLTVLVLRFLMIYSRAEVNHRHFSKINGVPTLLKVMQQNPTDLALQEHACRAIVNIGTDDKNRRILAREGGIDYVLDAIRNGTESPALLAAGCWALRNIAVNDGNKKLIAQKGGVDLIVRTMKANEKEILLQEQGCWALENISLKDETREAVVKSGAIPVLLTSMKTFPAERKLQEACCWAISNLSYHPKGREALRQFSATELLMAASTKFPDIESIQKHVASAVSQISNDEQIDSDEETMDSSDAKTNEKVAVVRKGFLIKQGGRIKTWNRRWFVLDSQKLTYFKTEKEDIALGVIMLTKSEGVLEDTDKKHTFMIVTQQRTYKLVAANRHEMAEWIAAVKNVRQNMKPLKAQPSSSSQKAQEFKSSASVSSHKSQDASSTVATNTTNSPFATAVPTTDSVQSATDSSYDMPEEIPMHELEAVCLAVCLQTLELRSVPIFRKLMGTTNNDIIGSYIARHVTNIILNERKDEVAVLDSDGMPSSSFYDVSKIERLVKSLLEVSLEETLQDEALTKSLLDQAKPYLLDVAADCGLRRTMEDKHIALSYVNMLMELPQGESEYSIYAVFDGHGGRRAADYASTHLWPNIIRNTRKERVVLPDEEPPEIDPFVALLQESFTETNDNFFDYIERRNLLDNCGATCVMCVIKDNTLFLSWCGDSEAALYMKDGSLQKMCDPHKASLESEKDRIELLGGFVQDVSGTLRLNGMLAVTRSFGDVRFRRFVTAEPEVKQHPLSGQEDFLVLACDGLWDVMSVEEVGKFIKTYQQDHSDNEGVAEALISQALALHSNDNISIIILFFK
eukprot:Lithocolla_globosa_v1_NODE_721_length_3385_cov_11.766967.p1 type:complete len:874 gc:universal NODE_721_length_3385_cov_11.766967:713-3334(+)